MMRRWINVVGSFIQCAGPNQCSANLGVDGYIQAIKVGAAATVFVRQVIQVQKDGQDAHPLRSGFVERNVVVVHIVELSFCIP